MEPSCLAADLYREIDGATKISFVKLNSYDGMHSTGRVDEVIGLTEDIKGEGHHHYRRHR